MTRTPTIKTNCFVDLRDEVDRWLERLLPPVTQEPTMLHEAMRYSVLAGGKRIRPILALVSYKSAGGHDDAIYPAACALEMLHTYSLIHDDLPCMDNDDFRRGQPTLHRKYPEYIAVLAGDALHVLAFEILAATSNCQAVTEVSRAIGTTGMLGGQVKDVQAEGQAVDLAQIEDIHRRKTAALITAASRLGAILAGANPRHLDCLQEFGENLGLAFQIVDDILDVEGDPEVLGKATGADDRLSKATYPKAVGLERSRQIARDLTERAKQAVVDLPEGDKFALLADYIFSRGE
ncbi:MAG: polyprenyl synthetase family protein [bacterium]